MTTYILGHADSDGRFAIWAAQNKLRQEGLISIHEVQYNNPMPLDLASLAANDEVHIVDFSYDTATLNEIAARVKRLIVLDHHKSARDNLQLFIDQVNSGFFGPAKDIQVIFDMEKSGALLAWEFYNKGEPVPYACKLVNDRDLWRFEYGDQSRAFESYIRTFGEPSKMDWWQELHDNPQVLESHISTGMTVLKADRQTIRKFVASKRNWEIINIAVDGINRRAVVYEGMGILHSELAEQFYTTMDDIDLTIEWRRKERDRIVFSLRSNKISVLPLAQAMGGGGHPAAAGFSLPLRGGLDFVLNALTNY